MVAGYAVTRIVTKAAILFFGLDTWLKWKAEQHADVAVKLLNAKKLAVLHDG
jgi:hypothetical protein